MQTTVTNGEITTVFDVAEFNVNVGESARIDVNEAVNYIKTGQAEVQETVDEGIADFNQNASEKTAEFNSNATNKTTAFNENANSKTGDFNTNASAKTTAFNDNATSKTNTFNQNATDKTTAFNNNASEKTTAFNDNYTEKKAVIDSQVQLAKDWATKTDGTVDGSEYSAKYYAEQTASLLSTKQDLLTSSNAGTGISITGSGSGVVISNTQTSAEWGNITGTLSDQTDLANALSAKYDASNPDGFITGITSGDVTTALGYTPVNPTSLATVATSGSYNDLSNKPIVDQTYDGTSTNAQSGVAVASAISGKADTDLSNLTSQGQNIANWSSNVTNCITEIPQDIKLELNNGTLTLKAGSKVYVPNGVGVFDTVTIDTDKIRNMSAWSSNTYLLSYIPSYGDIVTSVLSLATSGASDSGTSNHWWYDTTNNKIKSLESGSYTYNDVALPIAIVTIVNGTGVTSIDQVFNGFGYIGSTVFALPGVKGLIPNGRNEDGSLKNIEFVLNNVRTNLNIGTNRTEVWINSSFIFNRIIQNSYYYDEEKNLFFTTDTNEVRKTAFIGDLTVDSSDKITSFTHKTAFHALDYNDSSTISGWSMPSSRYIDLTLGASDSTYTAPANGWAMVTQAFSDSCYIGLTTVYPDKDGICMSSQYNSAITLNAYIPVSKGETFKVFYGGTKVANSANRFVFIYAEGEN